MLSSDAAPPLAAPVEAPFGMLPIGSRGSSAVTLLFSICSISRGKSELALVARMGTAKPASMATSKNNESAL